jgi:glycosyltransferase involved in cell wall biosynthesis
MVAATVLIPTHNHGQTLAHAVASVQTQTLQDLELFIVGDGVTDETRDCIAELAKEEPRIRFFDFPKGPRKGEIHRHNALNEATGRIVAYLGDDDLWLPNHLAVLDQLLSDSDFGHTLHIGLDSQGELFAFASDLEFPHFRKKMLTELYNRFDFTFGAHTLEAYRRLPCGWDIPPPEFPYADLYMWRKFLAEPWCRARSVMVPTGICSQTHLRPHLTNRQRADELAYWLGESIKPEFHEMLWRRVAAIFARDLIRHEIGHETAVTIITEHSKTRLEQESQITEHLRSRHELERQITEHSKTRHEMERQITEHSKTRHELERQITEHSKTRHELERQITEHLRTRHELERQITEHLKTRHELESQITEHLRTRHELERQISEHSRTRNELDNQIATLQTRVAVGSDALNDVSMQLSALKKSRLLKIGRTLRRVAGQAMPY